MKHALVIVGILMIELSVWGQTVGGDYIGEMQEKAELLVFQMGTLDRNVQADVATTHLMRATNSMHLDWPRTEFENWGGVIPPFVLGRVSSSPQDRHTRKHSRRHHGRLR
jgi:hypothetical protein